jgi:pimeloyl-ACP methyl ester carboxylesterase
MGASGAGPLAHLRWDGGGARVLLLHGIGGGSRAWDDGASRTGQRLADAGFDAVAVDLPGYGASPIVAPLTIAAMARAALEAIAAFDDHRSVAVVGHSMGGMVAQEMAYLDPRRIDALVLVGTSPAFGKPDGAWQERFLRERLAPLDAGQGMAALAPMLVRAMCAPGTDDARLAFAAGLMAAVPESTYRAALRGLMGFDRRANLSRLAMPVLALAGELDPNAPPAVMQGMAQRIPGAEYLALPAVGHLVNIEAPEAFANAVIDFLRRRVKP